MKWGNRQVANQPGRILLVLAWPGELGTFGLEGLVEERSISTNPTAGGNATLMSLI